MSDHAHAHDDTFHAPHVVSPRAFMAVLGALLTLTVLTVVVSRFNFGDFNLLIAMAIAALKASMVIAVFMHLRWDTPINSIYFLGAFVFVSLLFIFTLGDLATRGAANSEHLLRAPIPDVIVPTGFGTGH